MRLPVELVYVIKSYQDRIRSISFAEAARRLLESHPEVVALARELAYTGEDTSPQPNS